MQLSKNGVSLAMLLVAVGYLFKVDITIDTANEVVAAATLLLSFIGMVWNQFARPESKFLLFKDR